MPALRIPGSTYRVQFNAGFRFADAGQLAPYLDRLGITDLYSSPWFKPRSGSEHGYDITNPLRINTEVGTEQDFEALSQQLRERGIGLMLDIVPNHMAASWENPWWTDVLENGSASEFAFFFDIQWHPAITKAAFLQDNRLMLPILGDLYGHVLENQELCLTIEEAGLFVRYYHTRLPLDPKSYPAVLEPALAQRPGLAELEAVLEAVRRLPGRHERAPKRLEERRRNKELIKRRLWQAYRSRPEVRHTIDQTLRVLNGVRGKPASFETLDRILSEQVYRMAHWKIGYEEINYRRFFDISDLVRLRTELPEVFELRHRRLLELVNSGRVSGVRVDHVDGLFDPAGYLEQLQQAIGGEPRFYVVVEKVLGRGETLPLDWRTDGTTGYDFLNLVNGIFIDPVGLARLEQIYADFVGRRVHFAEIGYAANKQVIQQLFAGDLRALAHELGELAAYHRCARDVPLSELMQVLVEVTACLPIYRTYVRGFEISETDREQIERTLALARRRTPEDQVSNAAFDFIRRVLLVDPPYYIADQRPAWLRFVMRWQQFSGPAMAKGLEDTAFYLHHSLLSLNEVGSDPLRDQPPVDMAGFHEFNRRRMEHWPHAMNATSTHDTKRGEDVRARLNVLSDIPDEWAARLAEWSGWNRDKKTVVEGALVPDPAEEVLIYQTLLGTRPPDGEDEAAWIERVGQFLVKAAREGKAHSSWIQPHAAYEAALQEFVRKILEPGPFRDDFLRFFDCIAFHGSVNSLGQVVLKIVCPGVPDFYQGCELWNLSLVDPDNRRPVDYARRSAMLEDLRCRNERDRAALARELAAHPQRDEAKMFVTHQALQFRRAHAELFMRGEYVPVWASGDRAPHVAALARHWQGEWVMAVVPRWLARMDCRPPGVAMAAWGSTELALPPGAPAAWSNVFTGATPESLQIPELLRDFPVALLEGR